MHVAAGRPRREIAHWQTFSVESGEVRILVSYNRVLFINIYTYMYNYVHMACGISFVKIEIDLHRWNNTVSVELLMSLGKFPWAPVDGPVASCHMTALRYFERGSMGGESNSFWFEGDWWNQLQTPADLDDYIRFWKKMRLLPAFKGKGRTGV